MTGAFLPAIQILNKRELGREMQPGEFYVGRPSALGNPLIVGRDGTRDEVIAGYRRWLARMLEQRNAAVLALLDLILYRVRQGNVKLYCWCHPLSCHAEVIREVVQDALDSGVYRVR